MCVFREFISLSLPPLLFSLLAPNCSCARFCASSERKKAHKKKTHTLDITNTRANHHPTHTAKHRERERRARRITHTCDALMCAAAAVGGSYKCVAWHGVAWRAFHALVLLGAMALCIYFFFSFFFFFSFNTHVPYNFLLGFIFFCALASRVPFAYAWYIFFIISATRSLSLLGLSHTLWRVSGFTAWVWVWCSWRWGGGAAFYRNENARFVTKTTTMRMRRGWIDN